MGFHYSNQSSGAKCSKCKGSPQRAPPGYCMHFVCDQSVSVSTAMIHKFTDDNLRSCVRLSRSALTTDPSLLSCQSTALTPAYDSLCCSVKYNHSKAIVSLGLANLSTACLNLITITGWRHLQMEKQSMALKHSS